jgi:uncharacterized delta-60 repeat protein
MFPRKLALLAAGLALLCAVHTADAAPGDFDYGFGDRGLVRFGFGHGSDELMSMTQDLDGKYVVAGHVANGLHRELAIARFNTDGTLDPTFDGDGKLITSFAPNLSTTDLPVPIRLQSNGKLVVACGWRTGSGNSDFMVARFNADGSPDLTFSGDGFVTTDIFGANDQVGGMAIQLDGKIVVVGHAFSGSNSDFTVVRYDTTGALDPTFDGDGIVTVGFGFSDQAHAVAIQPDGKILVVGRAEVALVNYGVAMLRLNPDGTLDGSFDGDGKVTSDLSVGSDYALAVGFQTSIIDPTKIVIGGGSNNRMAVLRYNLNGSLDTTFDGDGAVYILGSPRAEARSVIVQFSGVMGPSRIIVGGVIGVGGVEQFGVARLFLNGAFDTALDGDGIVTTQVGAFSGASAVQVPFGKIVAVGTGMPIFSRDFTLIRYNGDGTLDNTFDGDGIRTEDIGNNSAIGHALALQPNGKVVAVGRFVFANDYIYGVARVNGDGTLDPAFDGDGRVVLDVTAGGGDFPHAVALQPDGKIVIVGHSTFNASAEADMVVVRLLPNGALDATFDGDGIKTIGLATFDIANAVKVQADGQIVIAGSSNNGSRTDSAILRLNPDGTFDSSFSGDGILIASLGFLNNGLNALVLQPDGSIVVAGGVDVAGDNEIVVARYLADGLPDGKFGAGGITHIPIAGTNETGFGLALHGDGRIVVAGTSTNGSFQESAVVACLTPDGVPDTGFDGDGHAFYSVGTAGTRSPGLALQNDEKLILVGTTWNTGLPQDFFALRLFEGGTRDYAYGNVGNATSLGAFFPGADDGPGGVVIDLYDRTTLVGYAGGLMGLARFVGDVGLVDVPTSRLPAAARVSLAGPNPFAVGTTVTFELPAGGPIALTVYAVNGARVRTLAAGPWAAGSHRVAWDGADEAGRAAAPGIYFIRLDAVSEVVTTRAVKVQHGL